MKKILLLTGAILLSTGAFAQKFEWGPKAGFGAVWETTPEVILGGGLHMGIVGEYVISKRFGIQAELLYAWNWTWGNWSDDVYDEEWGINWPDIGYSDNYIQMPILAKIYIVRGLSFDIGTQFGYLTHSRIFLDGQSFSRYEFMNKFEAAAVIGISYKIRGRVDISTRVNVGLTDKYKYQSGKNVALQTSVGFRFK